eukprot:gnl/Spiro4/25590_TR12742_c0_g1_i1.p1 gnl/Spiro4/25590_TR12742_c0_g1~~gnl/Spiro4/25590_TR12742_c0_g1_i1.p1  ORF type:complete len:278 (-),score=61.16 gnl/Spiro4/25590_TR12742_c0_g1_i1:225-1019(-)
MTSQSANLWIDKRTVSDRPLNPFWNHNFWKSVQSFADPTSFTAFEGTAYGLVRRAPTPKGYVWSSDNPNMAAELYKLGDDETHNRPRCHWALYGGQVHYAGHIPHPRITKRPTSDQMEPKSVIALDYHLGIQARYFVDFLVKHKPWHGAHLRKPAINWKPFLEAAREPLRFLEMRSHPNPCKALTFPGHFGRHTIQSASPQWHRFYTWGSFNYSYWGAVVIFVAWAFKMSYGAMKDYIYKKAELKVNMLLADDRLDPELIKALN